MSDNRNPRFADFEQHIETKMGISYTIHQDNGTGHCTTCGTEWPTECAVEKNAVYVAVASESA